MKQHTTAKQLGELSGEGKDRLSEWVIKSKYHTTLNPIRDKILPLLSIGQMIEFLGDDMDIIITKRAKVWVGQGKYRASELCDALWEAVKEVLNEKTIKKNPSQKAR